MYFLRFWWSYANQKNSIIKGLIQPKRVFRRAVHFYHQKKANRLCMKFSSTLKTSVQRWLNHLFQNQSTFFCCLLFFKKYINLQIKVNQMVSKQGQGPPQSFKINFRRILSIPKLLRALSLSTIFVENLFWLLENASKISIEIFSVMPLPRQNSPPGYYHHPQAIENYSFPQCPAPL